MAAAARTSTLRFQALSAAGRSVVVGLGANLGNPKGEFVRALMALQEVNNLVAVSPLYRSAPIGPKQPDFLNAAVLLECFESLPGLLEHLKRLEVAAGRSTGERWGPRPLDLDILWAKDVVVTTSSLIIPHAQLCHRAFALRPLLDVFPGAREPRDGRAYASILSKLEQQRCDRVEGEKWWEEEVTLEPQG